MFQLENTIRVRGGWAGVLPAIWIGFLSNKKLTLIIEGSLLKNTNSYIFQKIPIDNKLIFIFDKCLLEKQKSTAPKNLSDFYPLLNKVCDSKDRQITGNQVSQAFGNTSAGFYVVV